MAASGFVSSDYLKLAAERAQAFKQRTYAFMNIQPGDQLLDVGCGPGLDTCQLALEVGPDGRVIGVDIDAGMIAQADALAAEKGCSAVVSHLVGDVSALVFADGAFASVRAERLLQVLPASYAPSSVVAELWRVLQAGGTLVLADADWGTASVNFSDVSIERRLMAFFASSMRPNGYAGRQLFSLLQALGAQDLQIEIVPMMHRDLALLPFGAGLVEKAVAANVISAAEGQRWLQETNEMVQAGQLFASVNMVIASGRKASRD